MHVAYSRGICSSQAKELNTTTGAMLAVGEGRKRSNSESKAFLRAKGK